MSSYLIRAFLRNTSISWVESSSLQFLDSHRKTYFAPKFQTIWLNWYFSGSNITHSAVVRPKVGIWGRFNFTAGEVSYLTGEDVKEPQLGLTSEPGEGFIVSLKEFDRRFSPHVVNTLNLFNILNILWISEYDHAHSKSIEKYDICFASSIK